MKLPFLLLSGMAAVLPLAQAQCPNSAVFLATGTQVRGYATTVGAPAATTPCQVIQGANTGLQDANSLTISTHGFLYVLQFNPGSVSFFGPRDTGNIAPQRSFSVNTGDVLAISSDANNNVFFLDRHEVEPHVDILKAGSSSAQISFFLPDFNRGIATGLTVNNSGNIVVGGYDGSGNALVETLDTSVSLASPTVIGRLTGPATGILTGGSSQYANPISLANDALTGELYVYSASDATATAYANSEISVFAAGANGNVAPTRVLDGPGGVAGQPGFLNNKIAVGHDGRLFVATPNDTIYVYAADAQGAAAPTGIIRDSTIAERPTGSAGIAARN